jgi:hypothetical protein
MPESRHTGSISRFTYKNKNRVDLKNTQADAQIRRYLKCKGACCDYGGKSA